MISLYNMFKKAGHAALKVCKFIAKPFLAIKDACARVFVIIKTKWYSWILRRDAAAIPVNIESLDLRGANFDNIPCTALVEAAATIPANIKTLDLTSSRLFYKTSAEIALIFAAIPTNVITLILSFCGLETKTGDELAEAFAAIPAHVTTLELSGFDLAFLKEDGLAKALAALQGNVTNLNLSFNQLGSRKGATLAQAFAAISANVTTLNLCYNQLGRRTGAELALAFAAIKPPVTTLDLSGNDLGSKTPEELEQIFNAIPETSIKFGASELKESENLRDTLKSHRYYKFVSNNRFARYQGKAYKDKQTEYASGLALTFNVEGLNENVSSRILSFLTPSDWARLLQTSKKMSPYKHQAQSTERRLIAASNLDL